MSLRWHKYFLDLALISAKMSKDPSTKVGAIIIGENNEVLSSGFNGFPRGIKDTNERLLDRDTKLKLVVHAELNAILAAARNGIMLKGSTLYVICFDVEHNKVWGTLPCVRCTVEIIQSGIKHIVFCTTEYKPKRSWDMPIDTINLLVEAGVSFEEVILDM